MSKKFNALFEQITGKYQTAGFEIGQRVKFKKGTLKHEFFVSKGESFRQLVAACMDPKFDLNLKISSLKSVYPVTNDNYTGGPITTPDRVYADVIVEYAPGLYRTPMTVPIDVLEIQEDGINTGPVPDSLKYKYKYNYNDGEARHQSHVKGFETNLTNKNVKIPGGNKWADGPGGGNLPKTK